MANTKTLYDLLEDMKFYTGATSVEIESQVIDARWKFPIDEVPSVLMKKIVKRYTPILWGESHGQYAPKAYRVVLDDADDFCLNGRFR